MDISTVKIGNPKDRVKLKKGLAGESNIYIKIAKENNLMVLAGTDLHNNIEDIGRFLLSFEVFESMKYKGNQG